MRDERVAVAAEWAKIGLELAELRPGRLPAREMREAIETIGAAVTRSVDHVVLVAPKRRAKRDQAVS